MCYNHAYSDATSFIPIFMAMSENPDFSTLPKIGAPPAWLMALHKLIAPLSILQLGY
jgi:hypothetical protein